MGEIVPDRPAPRHDRTAYLGMVLFLASWAMLFAALLFGYGYVRSRAGVWPPPGSPRLPLFVPGINTAVIALASGAVHASLTAVRRGRLKWVAPAIFLAALLGAGFLALQIGVWLALAGRGFVPTEGPYASVFFGLTWVHAAHVAVGIVALAWLGVRALRGRLSVAERLPLRLWAMYWHFVGVVWLILFVTVYAI